MTQRLHGKKLFILKIGVDIRDIQFLVHTVRREQCEFKLQLVIELNFIVRHVTGNDKDYLRKIPRVVW